MAPPRTSSLGKTGSSFMSRLSQIRDKTGNKASTPLRSPASSPVIKVEPEWESSNGGTQTNGHQQVTSQNESGLSTIDEEKIKREAKEFADAAFERVNAEQAEEARREQERMEQARLEAERLEEEMREAERMEQELREAEERAEQERLEQERIEAERREQERLEAERLERERIERERLEAERIEKERIEQERLEAERIEQERIENERREIERQAREEASRQAEEAARCAEAVLQKAREDREMLSTDVDGIAEGLAFIGERLTALKEAITRDTTTDTGEAYIGTSAVLAKTMDLFEEAMTMVEEQIALFTESKVPEDDVFKSIEDLALTEQVAVDVKQDVQEKNEIAVAVNSAVNGKASLAGKPTNGSLEEKLTFDAWPSKQARPDAAQIRRVMLSNLHIKTTPTLVTSLVWGGRLEKIQYIAGETVAWVQFLSADDCKKYFAATANGIKVPGDEKRIVEVTLGDGPTSMNDVVRSYEKYGATRCVRMIGVEEDIGLGALIAYTSGEGAKKRGIERVINGKNEKGMRIVECRFTNIEDAFNFKVEVQKDIEFERCNVAFVPDPCEKATGVH